MSRRLQQRFVGGTLRYLSCLCLAWHTWIPNAYGQPPSLTPVSTPSTPRAITLVYDPRDGNLAIDAGGIQWTTIEIVSAGGQFIPAGPVFPDGCLMPPPWDVSPFSTRKLFLLTTRGYGDLTCGPVLPPHLTTADLIADLSFRGSLLPRGALNAHVATSPHLFVVPEPGGATQFGIAVWVALVALRNRLHL